LVIKNDPKLLGGVKEFQVARARAGGALTEWGIGKRGYTVAVQQENLIILIFLQIWVLLRTRARGDQKFAIPHKRFLNPNILRLPVLSRKYLINIYHPPATLKKNNQDPLLNSTTFKPRDR
jgi:hypothetical protein